MRQTGTLSGEVHTRIHPSMYPQLSTADHNNRPSLSPGFAWCTVISVELWLSTKTMSFLRQTNDCTDALSVCEKPTAGAPRAGEPTYCPHFRPSTVLIGDEISFKKQVRNIEKLIDSYSLQNDFSNAIGEMNSPPAVVLDINSSFGGSLNIQLVDKSLLLSHSHSRTRTRTHETEM